MFHKVFRGCATVLGLNNLSLNNSLLSFVPYKTVCLVTLTMAKRESELHALSAKDDCLRFNKDGSGTLQPFPGFVAKSRYCSLLMVVSWQLSLHSRLLAPCVQYVHYRFTSNIRRRFIWALIHLFIPLRNWRQKTSPQRISIFQTFKLAEDYPAHECHLVRLQGPRIIARQ